jgi:hypothetical protein
MTRHKEDRNQLEKKCTHEVQKEKVGKECPQCGETNETEAKFCAECGQNLYSDSRCPSCNSRISPNADICEACGRWLLEGKCKFCYADVGEGHTYCEECGNPTAGIVCPRCGKLSIFDFCKSCNIPLSLQANEMVQKTAQDPAFKKIALLFEQLTTTDDLAFSPEIKSKNISTAPATVTPWQNDQVMQLKTYREASQKSATSHKKSTAKAIFSSGQKQSISRLGEEVAQEEERRRIEEERRRQEEERKRREAEERQRRLQEQINKAMRKLSGKTFSSNQEARRFFMNMIAGLPEEVAKKIIDRGMKWRCNAYDCVHNSPSECADPSRGGIWLIS